MDGRTKKGGGEQKSKDKRAKSSEIRNFHQITVKQTQKREELKRQKKKGKIN